MRRLLQTLGITLSILGLVAGQAQALSNAQKEIYDEGINYFDYNVNSSTCNSTDTSSQGGGGSGVLNLNAKQVANAQTIIGIAKTENLGQAGAIIGIMTALTESNLKVYANSGVTPSLSNPNKQAVGSNYDSLGLFQQRVASGWSTLAPAAEASIEQSPSASQAYASQHADAVNQLMDPAYNAEAFFGSPSGSGAPSSLSKGLQNEQGWQSKDPWMAAQGVQGSGYSDGSNYKANFHNAQQVVAKYYDNSPAVPLPVSFTDSGKGNTSGDTTACNTTTGVVSGDIVKTALGLAWPQGGHGKEKSGATDAYQAAMPKAEGGDPGNDAWSDCGVFVATVMRSSGVDKNYALRTTDPTQMDYVKGNPKYQDLGQLKNSAQVQPGDIFISHDHTFIYVGPQKGGVSVAEASWRGHVPELDVPLSNYGGNGITFNNYNANEPFTTFRYIGG